MCGIAGLWQVTQDTERNALLARQMVAQIKHRGPEGDGFATGEGWALAHARLAIVDVEGGKQPIWNEFEDTVITGNNEIYNAPELRQELEASGHRFRTHSDTEVVLHGWEQWGDQVFSRLNGMFAVAIMDRRRRCLVIARDPMGIKPLHYSRVGNGFAFASEIKSLRTLPSVGTEPNWDAVHLFLNFRFVPDDQTLFQGVRRLPPGCFARLDERGLRIENFFSWDSLRAQEKLSKKTAHAALIEAIPQAVSRHLIADVEVAAYLSGGLDSSVVSALAAREKSGLRTYCMAFGEPTDENEDAGRVAKIIRSRHEDVFIGNRFLDRYEEILWHLEEPKINGMQGYLLAEKVAKEVKVVLSGLGGDELFAGYVNNDILYPMASFAHWFRKDGPFPLPSFLFQRMPAQNEHYLRAVELGLNMSDPVSFYAILRNCFDHNPSLLGKIYTKYPKHWHNLSIETLRQFYNPKNPDVLGELLILEARTKLVNDFLLTEDRVSMAHSLEVRVPLLDQKLVELAFRCPSSLHYRLGSKKRLFKQIARDWLPDEVLRKPKWGFSVNPYLLFQTQLRSFASQVLTEKSVKDFGLFSWKWISEVLNSAPHPRMRWHYFNLWVMAGFILWHDRFFAGGQLATRRTGT